MLLARFLAEGERTCERGWDAFIGSLPLSFAAVRCAALLLVSNSDETTAICEAARNHAPEGKGV